MPNGCGTHETPIGASEKRRRVGLERYFFFFFLFLGFSLIFHLISVYPLLKPNPLHHLPPEGTEGSCNWNNFQRKLCRLFSDSSQLGFSVVRQLRAKRPIRNCQISLPRHFFSTVHFFGHKWVKIVNVKFSWFIEFLRWKRQRSENCFFNDKGDVQMAHDNKPTEMSCACHWEQDLCIGYVEQHHEWSEIIAIKKLLVFIYSSIFSV